MKARHLTPLLAAAAALSLAAPSFGDVTVTLQGTNGTRQFSVEKLDGTPLTALDLGTGAPTQFQVHVKDTSFLPGLGQGSYSASATMTNLYLQDSAGNPNYNVKVPSSELSIGFGPTPLSIAGLSLVDLPKLGLTGTLSGCTNSVLGLTSLATSLGLTYASLTPDQLNALTALCTQIGLTAAPVTTTVDGALQTLTGLVPPSLLDAPTALSGAIGGTFTNPAYPAGATDKPASPPAATALTLMQGAPSLTTTLANLIKSALVSTGVPVVASSGTALTTPLSVTQSLASAGTGTVSGALSQLLQTLSAPQQVSTINSVLSFTGFSLPTLSDIHAVSGDYYSKPYLNANPRTPVAGTYGGTMTVTFVQS